MKHTYHIHGMTCNGCRNHVAEILSKVEGVTMVSIDLEKAEAIVQMENHVPIEKFQEALKKNGGTYSIHNHAEHNHPQKKEEEKPKGKGTFYCPMHCEGDKTYDEFDDCPICGMDLVREQNLSASSVTQYTCPMHPEIVRDEMGSCPICGMALVPMEPTESEEDKTYQKIIEKIQTCGCIYSSNFYYCHGRINSR